MDRQTTPYGASPTQVVERPTETLSSTCTTHMVGTSVHPVCSLAGGSVSESLLVSRLVDSDVIMDLMILWEPLILYPTLPKDPMSQC